MKKKIILFITVFFIYLHCIHSIGFGFHTLEIRTDSNFSKGVFPTSLLYQFDFPIPDFIQGNTSEIDFRIDNGLSFRELKQSPETGIPFAAVPNNPLDQFPKDYITIYNEMNLVFGQGFLKTPFSTKDTLKLWFTFDIRFENSYERFSYLMNSDNTEGLFQVSPYPHYENRFDIWLGQPELAGDRSTSNISFSLGLDFNMMNERITRRNGIKNSFWVRLNPIWTDIFKDGTHDYFLIWDKLDLAYTPFAIKMNGERDTTWFSIVLDNSTIYRFIKGNKVPYYVQGGNIYGTTALNTEHVITNRTSVSFYGPQINSYDCYPFITFFLDAGFSFGNLLNTNESLSYTETIASVGFKAEFIIFNIASIYYELGYVFDNSLNMEKEFITKIGFSFGV